MKFRTEKVDEIIVIENCDAKTLEAKLSDLSGIIIDVQFATVRTGVTGKTLHSALVLRRFKSDYREKYD